MSRLKKVIRNIIVLIILFFLFLKSFGFYLSPLTAHENSESSIHYGPSEVIHMEDFDDGKYILGKYDKWISCNTVNRKLFFLWRFGSDPIGIENDKTKPITYNWGVTNPYLRLYGIINDDRIKKIEITLDNGEVLSQTQFYDNLFLIAWKSSSNEKKFFKHIKGYDSNNNVIFDDGH